MSHSQNDVRPAADQDRLALERRQRIVADAGMGQQRAQVLLEQRRDGEARDVVAGEVEGPEGVGLDHVGAAGQQQRVDVELRPALADLDVEPVLLVEAGRQRLVKAAMLGLGAPVGLVAEFVQRLRAGRPQADDRGDGGATHQEANGAATGQAIGFHGHC